MPGGFRLDDKIVLVTGGASGIGYSIAELLAESGAHVVIADINFPGANEKALELREAGLKASALQLDLTDEKSIIDAVAKVITEYGIPWALVNNAGLQDREAFLEGTAKEWDRMVSVNARGPFLLSREIAGAMVKASSGGRIINIASAALRGSIVKGLVAYSGSKGAMLGMSLASAFELAEYGITVNTILPGGVPTPGSMNARGPAPEGPARRPPPLGMCEGRDIAAAVLYFASPAARCVTNQVLAVDGGFSIT